MQPNFLAILSTLVSVHPQKKSSPSLLRQKSFDSPFYNDSPKVRASTLSKKKQLGLVEDTINVRQFDQVALQNEATLEETMQKNLLTDLTFIQEANDSMINISNRKKELKSSQQGRSVYEVGSLQDTHQ